MCDKIQGYNTTYIFCASRAGKGICHGDSGGPIVDWQPIDGVSILATVIGATSFGADNIEDPYVQCADRTGIPLSYFADIQAGWDWIYETIEGKKLIST